MQGERATWRTGCLACTRTRKRKITETEPALARSLPSGRRDTTERVTGRLQWQDQVGASEPCQEVCHPETTGNVPRTWTTSKVGGEVWRWRAASAYGYVALRMPSRTSNLTTHWLAYKRTPAPNDTAVVSLPSSVTDLLTRYISL